MVVSGGANVSAGHVGIFDFDTVESSNLHRQVLHNTERVGWYKAESAKIGLQAYAVPYPVEALANLDPVSIPT